MSGLQILSSHISQLEGYSKKGTLAQRQNNPGNLKFVGQAGATKGEKGFAKFATPVHGQAALENQIKLDASRGLSLEKFIYKYAPPKENNTKAYLASVSRALRGTPKDQLAKLIQ